jgi:hypothetical protein
VEGNRAWRRVVAEVPGVEHDGGGDRRRQRWRRPVCRAAVARRPRAGTLEFWNESQTTQGGLLFIGSKIAEADLN